eukprot:5500748-Prymnesium_polylepis.2
MGAAQGDRRARTTKTMVRIHAPRLANHPSRLFERAAQSLSLGTCVESAASSTRRAALPHERPCACTPAARGVVRGRPSRAEAAAHLPCQRGSLKASDKTRSEKANR